MEALAFTVLILVPIAALINELMTSNNDPFNQGYEAGRACSGRNTNPYNYYTENHAFVSWDSGYCQGYNDTTGVVLP